MTLTELETRGYRQLPDGVYRFDGNLIGIIGRNGSGKSHLIEALPFLLTGEGHRPRMLRWGTTSGQVGLKFSHVQRDYVVKRNLHDAGATLVVTGEGLDQPMRITGSTAVSEALGKALGIDKETARQSMFAKQAEIDAVLFTDPKIRETAMQRLCGVGDSQKIHKTLGEILAKLPTQYDIDEDIARAESVVVSAEAELSMEEGKLEAFKANLAALPPSPTAERDAIVAKIHAAQTYLRAVGDLSQTDLQISEQKAALAAIVIPPDNPVELEKTIQAYSAALVDLKHEQEWKAKIQDVQAALSALHTPPSQEDLARLQASITDAVTQMSRASMSKDMYSNLMAAVSSLQGTQTCPLCGSYITDVDRLKRDVVGRLEEVNLAYMVGKQEREKAEASLRQLTESRTALEIARTRLETSRDKLSQDLKSLTYTEEKCEGTFKEAELALSVERAKLAAITDGMNKQSRVRGILDSLQASRDRISAFISSQPEAFTHEQVDQLANKASRCNDDIDKVRSAETNVAMAKGRVDVMRNKIGTMRADLETLKRKRDSSGTLREVTQVLGNVRDWFHYTVGPHTIAVSFLRRLTVGVNEFLGYFSAPFVVSPEEDTLGFRVSFTDGRTMPAGGYAEASELSGGEKIMLAVSFRLANYRIFASKLGILSLDEPTVYLDDENVGNFCKVVEALKNVVQAMNLQVLIATHEKAVMPYFSSTINLNSKEE